MSKPTSRETELDEVPDDIRQRMIEDFGPEEADEVYQYLLSRIPDGLPNGTRPRHLRCILYLAKGGRALLDEFIKMCLQDTRDVMLHAEYEVDSAGELVRKRDFSNPFGHESIANQRDC
jgi:hypothetical protein